MLPLLPQASFPYVGIADLRAVPLAVLSRLQPVPASFLKQLATDRDLFWDLPVGVQRQVGGDRAGGDGGLGERWAAGGGAFRVLWCVVVVGWVGKMKVAAFCSAMRAGWLSEQVSTASCLLVAGARPVWFRLCCSPAARFAT